MENNFICSWFLFYSQSSYKCQQLDLLTKVESEDELKKYFCSALPYIECGKNFQFEFPINITDFSSIFHYFTNHKGKIMEKLKEEEQKSYINSLRNYNNFSMKHHVYIIKCYMKAYVCDLAPLVRIRRAFVAMNYTKEIDLSDESFRNIHKQLLIWLFVSSGKGLQKLFPKSMQIVSESDFIKFASDCNLASLLVYCMYYYVQTKMIFFTIPVPEISAILKKETSDNDLIKAHTNIVVKVFSEICDNQDAFPIEENQLCSISKDSVQVTLTVALVFHWIFGNSLKSLQNLLKMSTSTDGMSNSLSQSQIRPTSIFLNSNTQKLEEMKPNMTYFMTNRSSSGNESLNQIFSSRKVGKETNLLDKVKENKPSSDGDTSPEIFLTPTEEDAPMTFSNSTTPATKLLSQKPILVNTIINPSIKEDNLDPMSISLKEEFQKKQQRKLTLQKPKVKIIPTNETTWLAQKNKNEINQIPLTPKKTNKTLSSPSSVDSQNLTKAQQNELQIQMGLQRQKIQNNLKKTAQKTGKSLEDSKQKVFFQVINRKSAPDRRHSMNSEDLKNQSNGHFDKKRLSCFEPNEINNCHDIIPEIKDNHSEIHMTNGDVKNVNVTMLIEKNWKAENCEENSNQMELPQSLQASDVAMSPVQIIHDQPPELPDFDNNDYKLQFNTPFKLNNISEVSILEEASESRKNSSTSISSLSSISNKSTDKVFLDQQEYCKSMSILNKSLTSLQEEIRILSMQQNSWTRQIQPLAPNKPCLLETCVDINKNFTDNNSVPETPTNNTISLTEITNSLNLKENYSPQVTDPSDNVSSNHSNISTSIPVEQPIKLPNIQFLSDSLQLNNPSSARNNKINNIRAINKWNNSNEIPSNIIKSNIIESNLCNNEITILSNDSPTSDENNKDSSMNAGENDNASIVQSFISYNTDDDVGDNMTSSTDSSVVSNVQPISFVIGTDQELEDAQKRKAEMLARREEKRKIKFELDRQKREEERENRLSATIDELMEREEKKRLEKEKRDSLFQKYLDRKKSESNPLSVAMEKRSASAANTPVKLRTSSKTPRPVAVSGKQDSVGDLPLASSRKNTWYSSMRISNRNTSQSTSKLNDDMAIMDSNKFGIPLPPQEYTGPKLFGKRKVKTNRSVIVNAISHCCLAGSCNEAAKEIVLKELADAEGTHFMILFRDARCQYRALYCFNLATDELNLVCGSGPKKVSHDMVEKFYKYNSGAKQFNLIVSTKHLSPAVDAICISSTYWNSRPGSQLLQNAVSVTSINQSKIRRSTKNISTTH